MNSKKFVFTGNITFAYKDEKNTFTINRLRLNVQEDDEKLFPQSIILIAEFDSSNIENLPFYKKGINTYELVMTIDKLKEKGGEFSQCFSLEDYIQAGCLNLDYYVSSGAGKIDET